MHPLILTAQFILVLSLTLQNFHHKTHFQKYKTNLCKHLSAFFRFTNVQACFSLQISYEFHCKTVTTSDTFEIFLKVHRKK